MKKGTRNDQLESLQKQVAEINNAIGCNKIKVELGEYNFFEVIYGDKKYVGGYYDAEKFLSFVIIGVELKATSNDELYREQELEYRKQDAERHAEDMGVDCILSEDDLELDVRLMLEEGLAQIHKCLVDFIDCYDFTDEDIQAYDSLMRQFGVYDESKTCRDM